MNIIMVMADSFRRDHIGAYGGTKIQTPNLDRLAAESVVFDHAYPEGLPTLPVRTAMFTGNYTLTNRFWQGLTPQDYTLSEVLDEYDYTNVMITDTYHMFKPNMNYHRGFHEYQWIRGQESDAYKTRPHTQDLDRYLKPEMYGNQMVRIVDQYLRNVEGRKGEEDYFSAKVMGQAINWLDENQSLGSPFFLYVDSFDPHEPWDAPPCYLEKYTDPEYRGNWIFSPKGGENSWLTPAELEHTRNLYAAEAAFVDEQLGKLLDKIRELGLMENSLIIFLADHGHPLGEHGKMLKMVDQLYSPLLQIPLMIRLPGAEMAGKRIDALVQTVDLFPTIMEFLGFEQENEFLQGKSLLPLINGQCGKVRDFATMGFFSSEERCVRDQEWSYIRTLDGCLNELYDLVNDPNETKNLCEELPEKAAEMEKALARTLKVRWQKEHWLQNRFDVPGKCETRFPPLRYWKK
jgi:arylsulfatase A-like enzyme